MQERHAHGRSNERHRAHKTGRDHHGVLMPVHQAEHQNKRQGNRTDIHNALPQADMQHQIPQQSDNGKHDHQHIPHAPLIAALNPVERGHHNQRNQQAEHRILRIHIDILAGRHLVVRNLARQSQHQQLQQIQPTIMRMAIPVEQQPRIDGNGTPGHDLADHGDAQRRHILGDVPEHSGNHRDARHGQEHEDGADHLKIEHRQPASLRLTTPDELGAVRFRILLFHYSPLVRSHIGRLYAVLHSSRLPTPQDEFQHRIIIGAPARQRSALTGQGIVGR